jgi:hypothetical protein
VVVKVSPVGDQFDSTDSDDNVCPNPELSIYAKTLLGVSEAVNIESIVQMGSSKLPDASISTLLDV